MGRPKGSRNKNLNLNGIVFIGKTAHIIIESKKYGVLSCIIDSEDYDKVKFSRWQVIKRRDVFHVQSSFDHNIYLHRIILPGHKLIDHKNGDGLDNRKENLRPADKRTNAQNRRVTPGTFKGVLRARSGGFLARIVIEGKQKYLGTFPSREEAAKAYNEAALKYFGEFARLNVIDD
jgi:hypothetical protein